MNRMQRAAGIVALTALLAACAAPGTGGVATEPSGSSGAGAAGTSSMNPVTSPAASAAVDGGVARVDIGALTADPSSFTGQQVKVLARVDQVLVDGVAFVTSPSATEEDQIAVLVRPDAQVDKDIVEGSVVWVDGTVVGLTDQELADAGLDFSLDQLGDFDGEFAIVADAISDPLASSN